MTKYEVVESLKPFMDETELVVRAEGEMFGFLLEYAPTGYGPDQDAAAIVIRVVA